VFFFSNSFGPWRFPFQLSLPEYSPASEAKHLSLRTDRLTSSEVEKVPLPVTFFPPDLPRFLCFPLGKTYFLHIVSLVLPARRRQLLEILYCSSLASPPPLGEVPPMRGTLFVRPIPEILYPHSEVLLCVFPMILSPPDSVVSWLRCVTLSFFESFSQLPFIVCLD